MTSSGPTSSDGLNRQDPASLEDLLTFWFQKSANGKNPEFWFKSTPVNDEFIANNFEHLLPPTFKMSNIIGNDDRTNLATIVLFDQVARHIRRHQRTTGIIPALFDTDSRTPLIHKDEIVGYFHIHAMTISYYLLDKNADDDFSPEEKCFLLMPLRHTFVKEHLDFAIEKMQSFRKPFLSQEIDESTKCQRQGPEIYQKFMRAALTASAHVDPKHVKPNEPINHNITDEDIYAILDQEEGTASARNLVKTRNVSHKSNIYKEIEKTLINLSYHIYDLHSRGEYPTDDWEGIAVSLSGGIDSMLTSLLVAEYAKERLGKNVVAIMINYDNRESCEIEVELVKRWCKNIGIDLYVRNITKIHRDWKTDRQMYEDVTRIMRFEMYRRVGYPVILGHNYNDTEENLWTNIWQVRSPENLWGMTPFSQEKGVITVRPLLKINKKDIYNTANALEVPHLENSTPPTCNRGRIRKELIRFIDEFHPGIMPGLGMIADIMKDLYKIVNTNVIPRFMEEKVIFYDEMQEDNTFAFINLPEGSPELDFGKGFWTTVVHQIYSNSEFFSNFPTRNSIINLEKNLSSAHYQKSIEMNRNIRVVYDRVGIRFVYKPNT
jgi:tRNA(Ile)-lysidine synthetase-like protein